MKFLLDANMPRSVIAVCKARGHDAIHVADQGIGSAPDDEIAAFARSGGQVLLTRDLDFSDIRTYPPQNFFDDTQMTLFVAASLIREVSDSTA